MIDREIFKRIKTLSQGPESDVVKALIEEVGEFARACRIEDKMKNSVLDEASTFEAIDMILVAIELYILRGGNFEDMASIANKKLEKWSKLLFHPVEAITKRAIFLTKFEIYINNDTRYYLDGVAETLNNIIKALKIYKIRARYSPKNEVYFITKETL